ncbi:MAG: polysaccharide deacetylase family protein [Solirubrobacterales bacterium]
MSPTLILTYHAIEAGPPPLCVEKDLFARHLAVLEDSGAEAVTISELADRLRAGRSTDDAVAITFDDGFASVARVAAPMLTERGLKATAFCVAGHLGGRNDWSSQPAGAPRRELATGEELAALAAEGFEIGSHGMEHLPLKDNSDEVLRRELLGSKEALGEVVGRPVRSLAYPYGVVPGHAARKLVESSYSAACTARISSAGADDDPLALPRVDAHYLRNPELLRRALGGSLGPYLLLRRLGANARRVVRKDYLEQPA